VVSNEIAPHDDRAAVVFGVHAKASRQEQGQWPEVLRRVAARIALRIPLRDTQPACAKSLHRGVQQRARHAAAALRYAFEAFSLPALASASSDAWKR